MQQVDYLGRRLTHPGARILDQQRHLAHLAARLQRGAAHSLIRADLHLDALQRRLAAAGPDVQGLQSHLQRLAQRLAISLERTLERRGAALSRLAAHLNALSPQLVLERGYSIVAREDGRIVQSADQVTAGEDVSLTFARGGAMARVTRTRS
jgi:exodeoxyribonuclease VII large subunit